MAKRCGHPDVNSALRGKIPGMLHARFINLPHLHVATCIGANSCSGKSAEVTEVRLLTNNADST